MKIVKNVEISNGCIQFEIESGWINPCINLDEEYLKSIIEHEIRSAQNMKTWGFLWLLQRKQTGSRELNPYPSYEIRFIFDRNELKERMLRDGFKYDAIRTVMGCIKKVQSGKRTSIQNYLTPLLTYPGYFKIKHELLFFKNKEHLLLTVELADETFDVY